MKAKKFPEHIGIILDGNRRYAKKLSRRPWDGHKLGAKTLEKVFDWGKELGVKEMTLYAFSMQNFKRSDDEKRFLFDIFRRYVKRALKDKRVMDEGLRVKVIGRTHLFPDDLQELFSEIVEKTRDNENYQVNFALGYGGREEIVDAVRKVVKEVFSGKLDIDDIDEESFKDYLYTSHEPDLIIRTGGDFRTSNFLPYQSTYSEWFFIKKFWPEFTKEDLKEIIAQFMSRERRFGR